MYIKMDIVTVRCSTVWGFIFVCQGPYTSKIASRELWNRSQQHINMIKKFDFPNFNYQVILSCHDFINQFGVSFLLLQKHVCFHQL